MSRLRRKFYGIDHVGLTFKSLDRLLSTYERLKSRNHTGLVDKSRPDHLVVLRGPRRHPTGIPDRHFPTAKATADYFHGSAFAENPIGVNFDPDYLLERLRSGAEPTELLHQGAGTRPGTTARANRRAVTWKTL